MAAGVMKAAWYDQNGPAREVMVVGDLPVPEPAAGEVLVRIRASGVNPSDVKSRAGVNRRKIFPRVVPHSDGAGVVAALGRGEDVARSGLREGDRVWVYNGQWQRPFGTAAEFVALPVQLARRLPDSVDFAAGACLGIPAQTAAACVWVEGEPRERTVLVQGGAGAVGHYAVQFARRAGARVIATVSNAEKAHLAAAAGAHDIVDYSRERVGARAIELTDGRGVDLIVDTEFGVNAEADREALAQYGTIAVYGSQKSPRIGLDFLPWLNRGASIRFVHVYSLPDRLRRPALAAIEDGLAAGTLVHNVALRFPLARIAEAHEAQESGRVVGNIVVEMD